jgi:tetratricopeptide (TPR) repeat protein
MLIAHSGKPTGTSRALARENNPAPYLSARERGADTTAVKREILHQVFQRLLSVTGRRPGKFVSKYVWPPQVELEEGPTVNAYAWVRHREVRGKKIPVTDPKTGKLFPYVAVHQGMMDDLVERDPDRLSFVVGHELAHIILGHVLGSSIAARAKTPTLATIFTREQEHDADVMGMQLALRAGYSIQGAREIWLRLMSEEFLRQHPSWRNYTSFEGRGFDHPAWSERLELIDKEKATLWRAMSAFENGVFFLAVQQYAPAAESFERVVDSDAFPNSYDAWANLGYARLMLYLDKLDVEDVARYEVGQLVTGSFYKRPETLERQVRGVDVELWNKAVAALRKALALNPRATLAKANLGVAYLMAPSGRDAAEAARLLDEASTSALSDSSLLTVSCGAVLNNAAVALAAAGEAEKAGERLRQAAAALRGQAWPTTALAYNRALLLSQSTDTTERRIAAALLNDYLLAERPSSLWWDKAYGLYAKLSSEPRPREEFIRRNRARHSLRPVTSVEVAPHVLVTLSETVGEATKKLGTVRPIPAVPGTTLVRLLYPERGIELLATRKVEAIFLRDGAPGLKVQHAGLGARAAELRVGMEAAQARLLLGLYYEEAPVTNPAVYYYFYPAIGVAVRYDGAGKVSELVVAQITVSE